MCSSGALHLDADALVLPAALPAWPASLEWHSNFVQCNVSVLIGLLRLLSDVDDESRRLTQGDGLLAQLDAVQTPEAGGGIIILSRFALPIYCMQNAAAACQMACTLKGYQEIVHVCVPP